MKFVTAYGKKKQVLVDKFEKTLTKQSFKDECDINKVLRNYIPPDEEKMLFADVSELDYQKSLDYVMEAQSGFNSLSADIRERFSNDPANFLQFVEDDKNKEEAYSLGLLSQKAKEVYEAKLKADKEAEKQRIMDEIKASQSTGNSA